MTLLAIALAAFLGSLHCVGMCGGFVALYSSGSGASMLGHGLYNLGRLITYCALGAIFAALGGVVDAAAATAGVARCAAVIVGAGMVVYGGMMVLGRALPSFGRGFVGIASSALGAGLKRIRQLPPPLIPFAIGLSTTLLPCGWLYMFVAVAAATGDPVAGVGIMFFFWLGTLPAMLSVGAGARVLLSALGDRAPRLAGALVILAGFAALSGHLVPHVHDHSAEAPMAEHLHHHH